MEGVAIKASILEMVSLGEGGEKTVGVKVFLVEDCREEVFVTKDEAGSVDGFGEAQERRLFGVRILRGRGTRFEVEGVEVEVSRSSKEKLLVTSSEGTT